MSTSGVYRSWADINAWCDRCDWSGDTQICDDIEDMRATWTCPNCEKEHVEVQ